MSLHRIHRDFQTADCQTGAAAIFGRVDEPTKHPGQHTWQPREIARTWRGRRGCTYSKSATRHRSIYIAITHEAALLRARVARSCETRRSRKPSLLPRENAQCLSEIFEITRSNGRDGITPNDPLYRASVWCGTAARRGQITGIISIGAKAAGAIYVTFMGAF